MMISIKQEGPDLRGRSADANNARMRTRINSHGHEIIHFGNAEYGLVDVVARKTMIRCPLMVGVVHEN